MGRLLNNDTNYRIVAGEDLTVQPVALGDDGKVVAFDGENDYIGWTVQDVATGEVAAVIRNGKVGGLTLDGGVEEGDFITYDGSAYTKATEEDTAVGFVPFGGKTSREPVNVFIVVGVTPVAAE